MASMKKELSRFIGTNTYYTRAADLMALPINQLLKVSPQQIKRKTIRNTDLNTILSISKNKNTTQKVKIIKELIRKKTNPKNVNNNVRGPNGKLIWSPNIGRKISLELERQTRLLEKNNAAAIDRRKNPQKFYNLHTAQAARFNNLQTNQAARLNNLAATLSKQRSAKNNMARKHNERRGSAQNPMRSRN